jgi:hypothetical protein
MDFDPPPQPHRHETFLTIFLTGIAALGFLTFLIVISGGFFFYVLAAMAGIGVFALLHYLLWGYSFSEEVAGEREEEEARERAEADDSYFDEPT